VLIHPVIWIYLICRIDHEQLVAFPGYLSEITPAVTVQDEEYVEAE